MSAQSHVIGQPMEGSGRFVVLTPKTGILKDRLRLTKPRKLVKTMNNVQSTTWSSEFYYVDDSGKNCKPVTTIWSSQKSWCDYSYPYKSNPNTHKEENCVGFKTTYPLQSDMESLSSDEKFTKKSSDTIYDLVYETLLEYRSASIEEFPEECQDILEKAEKKKDRSLAVRPFFVMRNVSKDIKTPDPSKSKVMYIDFNVSAPKDDKGIALTGRNLRCNTKITGPKNAPLSAFEICGKYGNVRVVIEWLGVNFNCGGTTSKMAAIIKYRLNQITWTPAGTPSIPQLLTNDDEVGSEDESDEKTDVKNVPVEDASDDSDTSDSEGELDPFGSSKSEPEPEPEPAPAPKRMTAAERRAAIQKNKK